ncbi:LysR family transcriptional regulator [Vibrio gallicus]|uniref:LysR family transcriptional regulator n=1 Tax=Vibrio gallicus TaxID=190897 RepID=UPI0021C279DE|nr:LysR family transcriptional regulator [Vibrio gallicus]
MDLKLLQVFKAVYEQGSLSAAADFLDVTQPAVTASIKKLEAELDYQLFIRSGRSIMPSPDGVQLYDKIYQHINAIQDSLSAKQTLNVYAVETTYFVLGDVPNINLKESPAYEEQIYADLRAGVVDIAIDYFSLKESAFLYEDVLQETLVGVHNSKSSFTYQEYMQATHILVNLRRHNQSIVELFGKLGSRNVGSTANGTTNAIIAANKTNSVTVTTRSLIPFAEQLGMVAFELPFEAKSIGVKLTYHKRYKNDPLFKSIIANIKQVLKYN